MKSMKKETLSKTSSFRIDWSSRMITWNVNALKLNMKQKLQYMETMIIQEKIKIKSKPNTPLLSVLCRQQLKGCKSAPESSIKQIEY